MKTIKVSNTIDLPIPELRGSLGAIKFPAFGEIKYDGEFTFIVFSNNKILTMNKYNKLRTNFSALNFIKAGLNCTSAIMLAELYYGDGKRNALYKLNSNKESNDLKLAVFDLVNCDGVDMTASPLLDRKEMLHKILASPPIKPTVLNGPVDAINFFHRMVTDGYEGAVIKSMDSRLVRGPCSWVKLKMKDRSDYEVISIDPNKERIAVAVPKVPSSPVQRWVGVGVKASTRYKRHINVGDKVTIEHQGVLPSGSLRHPVLIPKKEWK